MVPISIKAGVGISEFWSLTIREIKSVVDTYIEKENETSRKEASKIYTTAQLTAAFVGSVLNGKDIPDIGAVFPELFMKEETPQEDWESIILKERFKDYARGWNKKLAKSRKAN